MTLVVLDPSANIARVAGSLGVPLILLPQAGSGVTGFIGKPVASVITVDLADHPALLDLARTVLARSAPRAVVSVTERGLEAAALLSETLGTPGTPLRVVQGIRDKRALRTTLAARAPELSVDFADPRDAEATRRLFAAHERVVLKPATGTASTGVRLLHTIAELNTVDISADWLLEAWVDGPEYSVETFSHQGNHEIMAIVLQEKSRWNQFVEVSHYLPSPGLTEAGVSAIRRAVAKALDALELRDGPSHTEVKLCEGRAFIIETHNRPAGDGLASLVEATTGVDWRRTSIGWPLGVRPEPVPPSAPAAAITFFTAEPGVVVDIQPPASTVADVTVDDWRIEASVGDTVHPLTSSKDRVGWALLSGASPEACRAAVRQLQAAPPVQTREQ